MEVIILGSGSPLPDPNRAGPATLVRTAGRDLLFDAGRGVLMRLVAAGSGPVQVERLLLTHLHSDHITDLNDLLTMNWTMSQAPRPLPVTGPPGTGELAERTLAMLAQDIGYRRAHHADLGWDPSAEVSEVTDGVVLDDGTVRIIAAPTEHAPVRPTVGYRIEAEGKAVVIGGDSIPCAGLDQLCDGADVYVQTVLRRSLIESFPVARLRDILAYHSSIEDAAATAKRCGVGTLVLTHLIPSPFPGTEKDWIAEAEAVFAGNVVLASDLLRIGA
ncbi:MAG TPA: MBL fold metallo-hydrolase [Streptosporangiaceae bacterium]|nr:MBL fold metallo-hydrolase [Streptosporangiaceae bacterium]